MAAGSRVVGASSLDYDPARAGYETWEKLPYISDPGFAGALARLIAKHGIDAIHAPHYVVWGHLEANLASIAPGVTLLGGPSLLDAEQGYRDLQARLSRFDGEPFYAPALPPRPRPPTARP